MSHHLHIAGSTFELPDAKAAVELVNKVQGALDAGGARLNVKLKDGGSVIIFVSEHTDVAVSGSSDEPEKGLQIF